MKKQILIVTILLCVSLNADATPIASSTMREATDVIPKMRGILSKLWDNSFSTKNKFIPQLKMRQNFSTITTPKTIVPPPMVKKTVRILSIDGGGIRGIIPLTILSHLEEDTKKPIAQLFDVITGTSTGGIIALGLNVPNERDTLSIQPVIYKIFIKIIMIKYFIRIFL